jgi:uncharacterized phiE125 gp8 family phage protein
MRQIEIVSTTGSELITTSDVKDYVRIDTTADDTLIDRMIVQARIWCENYISRDIVAKARKYYLDKAEGFIQIPFAPVATITSVTVQGSSAEYQEKGLNKEQIILTSGVNQVLSGSNTSFAMEVLITYTTAGLSDDLIKQALLQMVSTYYDNRTDFIQGKNVNEIPTNVKSILASYKTMFV